MFLPVRVVFTLEVWTLASGGGIVFRNNQGAHLLNQDSLLKMVNDTLLRAHEQESADEGDKFF